MIKILEKINIPKLLKSYFLLQNNIVWTEQFKCKQAGLQYKADEDCWKSAVGKRRDDESLYTNLNPYFKDSFFEELIQKFNLKRTRLMIVEPWCCYSMHKDDHPRIHIPIITNPGCYFVFKEGIVEHLALGKIFWVDTRKYHTFMNCSDKSRLHLVGVVEE
jgi:hypothetical protein